MAPRHRGANRTGRSSRSFRSTSSLFWLERVVRLRIADEHPLRGEWGFDRVEGQEFAHEPFPSEWRSGVLLAIDRRFLGGRLRSRRGRHGDDVGQARLPRPGTVSDGVLRDDLADRRGP